jgi:hypothetical protein
MAVHDRLSDISVRLEDLLPSDRLIALYALSIAFPTRVETLDWKSRMDRIRAAVNPTLAELNEILISAARIANYLKAYMAE